MPKVNEGVFVRKEQPLKSRKETLVSVVDTIRLLEHHEELKDIQNRKQKNLRVLKVILNDCKADLKELEELLPEVREMMPKKKTVAVKISAKDLERGYGIKYDIAKQMAIVKGNAKDLEKKYSIEYEIAKQIADKNFDFDVYVKKFKNVNPDFIAYTLVEIPKEISKLHGMDISDLKNDDFEFILTKLNNKDIEQSEVIEFLMKRLKDKKRVKEIPKISKLELEIRKIREKIDRLNI